MKNRMRKSVSVLAATATLVALIGGLGCAFGEIYWSDPLKREYSLGEVQKRYTGLVRFGAFVRASKFVDPELAESFVSLFPSRGDLVFTDHESQRIDFADNGKRDSATVKVTYSAYYTHSPVVFEIVEIQHWYREGPSNNWLVRPEFQGLETFAAAH